MIVSTLLPRIRDSTDFARLAGSLSRYAGKIRHRDPPLQNAGKPNYRASVNNILQHGRCLSIAPSIRQFVDAFQRISAYTNGMLGIGLHHPACRRNARVIKTRLKD